MEVLFECAAGDDAGDAKGGGAGEGRRGAWFMGRNGGEKEKVWGDGGREGR